MPLFEKKTIDIAAKAAKENWNEWREDFEFGSNPENDPARLPVLRDRYRFCYFCKDYSLMQKVSLKTAEQVRMCLIAEGKFKNVIDDETGSALDVVAKELSKAFPGQTVDGRKRGALGEQRSLLSKLAAFAKPNKFIAYDRYARAGIYRLMHNRNHNSPYNKDYRSYIIDVWKGFREKGGGDEIREYLPSNFHDERFVLRVFDCCLMIKGGRQNLV